MDSSNAKELDASDISKLTTEVYLRRLVVHFPERKGIFQIGSKGPKGHIVSHISRDIQAGYVSYTVMVQKDGVSQVWRSFDNFQVEAEYHVDGGFS